MFSIGIDIGYATLKCVLVDENQKQIHKKTVFHYGSVDEVLKELLEEIVVSFEVKQCFIGVTGRKEKYFEAYQVNDISALVEGASTVNKAAKTIIEIGAQSSRLITGISEASKTNIQFFTNTSCSAGTGSFLEEQVSRLGIELEDYSSYVKKATKSVRIAGRCSVFSKTDMIHHQQAGEKTEDILLGLSYALVRNYKANVVQRNELKTPVIFAGGVAKNEGVVKALKEIFGFLEGDLILSEDCSNIGAIGAALLARDQKQLGNVVALMKGIDHKVKVITESIYKPLIKYGCNDSDGKHECENRVKSTLNTIIDVHIGIDIGSTSTNVVFINEDREVLAHRYIRTKGDPKKAVDDGIKSIQDEFKGQFHIKSIGTTGSGRKLIGKRLEADIIVNEITAQTKGAVEMDPEIDTIFEIGGQDSKYISVKDGRVVDFEMNKICAAGTGSFIEEQAKKLGISIEAYADTALKGDNPLDLGDRCTVFIEGNVSKALAEGQDKANITAGLSYSIVHNYLNRVVAKKPIGNRISLQGGVAYNQSVVNAFRAITGKEIIVLPFFSVIGALGVALLAKESVENKEAKVPVKNELQNIESEVERLFLKGYKGKVEKDKPTVGIPRVLFMHKLFPLFNTFFNELGLNVILSDQTNQSIIEMSQEYSLDETCYPIKLINGHVASLLKKDIDYLFLPSLYTMKHPVSKTREDYACVYMQTVPQIVSKVMDLEAKGIKLLSPALSFKFGKKYMMGTLMNLGKELGKNKAQTALALAKGMKRFKQFGDEVEALGKAVIGTLKEDEKVFVIVTRAYGIADEGLNMEIPKKLRKMGYKVLTLSNIPAHNVDTSDDYPNMFWPFGQHILSGAKIIRSSKNLYAIYLTNHGCGPDSLLSHYFKEEMNGKPYLHIEVDEHASSVGVMTRLEAFVESLKNETHREITIENIKESVRLTEDKETMYIPYLYPYSTLLKTLLIKKGVNAKEMLPTNRASLEMGNTYSLSKESVSLTSLLGDVLLQLKKKAEGTTTIWIPRNEGSEVSGQFSRIIEQKIKQAGYKKVKVEAPFMEDMLTDEKYGIEYGLMLIAGDLIMTSDKKNRDENLEIFLKHIRLNTLTTEVLVMMASKVYEQLEHQQYRKRIYVLGELSVVYNQSLNQNRLEALEAENKLYYAPVAEMMWFEWHDYLINKKKINKELEKNLEKISTTIDLVSRKLREFSAFDKDLNELKKAANLKLPLYAGGNGRYRMIKQFRSPDCMNGLIIVNSMYENTGTILKILKDKDEINQPVIELSFDASEHGGHEEKINNFMYYV